MDFIRWACLIVLSLFLLEGFVLSVFPEQFRQLVSEADPAALKVAGFVETLIAVTLMAALLRG